MELGKGERYHIDAEGKYVVLTIKKGLFYTLMRTAKWGVRDHEYRTKVRTGGVNKGKNQRLVPPSHKEAIYAIANKIATKTN